MGQALQKFKDSGKTITAIGDNYSRSSYYLASFADEIIINDYGYIDLDGFEIELFYKSLLDKLKIDFNVLGLELSNLLSNLILGIRCQMKQRKQI